MEAAPERPPVRVAPTFAKGFLMGCADVVPGVSGGTMALIVGIWERLIEAIRSFDPAALALLGKGRVREVFERVDGLFLGVLFAGIATAFLSLAKPLEHALEARPDLVWAFFFGLVLASVWAVHERLGRWTAPAAVATALGTVGAYFLVGLVPAETPATAPWFFASGAIAICAMILPGISGSFILVLLGKYKQVIGAVNDRDLLTVGLVAAGCAVGILVFVRVLHWLLARAHDTTMAVLIGLMLGSLRKIWPWKVTVETMIDRHGVEVPKIQDNVVPDLASGQTWIAVALAALGFGAVIALSAMARRAAAGDDAAPAPGAA